MAAPPVVRTMRLRASSLLFHFSASGPRTLFSFAVTRYCVTGISDKPYELIPPNRNPLGSRARCCGCFSVRSFGAAREGERDLVSKSYESGK